MYKNEKSVQNKLQICGVVDKRTGTDLQIVAQGDGDNGEAGGESEHWEQDEEVVDQLRLGRVTRQRHKVEREQTLDIVERKNSCTQQQRSHQLGTEQSISFKTETK